MWPDEGGKIPLVQEKMCSLGEEVLGSELGTSCRGEGYIP